MATRKARERRRLEKIEYMKKLHEAEEEKRKAKKKEPKPKKTAKKK